MKKFKTGLLLSIAVLFLSPPASLAEGDVGLIDLMGNFQTFTHKAGL